MCLTHSENSVFFKMKLNKMILSNLWKKQKKEKEQNRCSDYKNIRLLWILGRFYNESIHR